MAGTEAADEVAAFFESYRRAFERLDASAIADHFVYPSHVTSDGAEVALLVIATREQWMGQAERLLDMYRAIEFRSARVLDVRPVRLSARLVQAVVRWGLYDAVGRLLYDFNAAYTLASVGGVLRIAALAHNEVPRYRECLARLGFRRAADRQT
jgi:hypothetical protein